MGWVCLWKPFFIDKEREEAVLVSGNPALIASFSSGYIFHFQWSGWLLLFNIEVVATWVYDSVVGPGFKLYD